MLHLYLLGSFLVAGNLGLSLAQAPPDQPPPQALIQRAEQLEQEARELKGLGRHEAAKGAMAQAEEVRTWVARLNEGGERPTPFDPRNRELRRERARLQGELKELTDAGKGDEAAEIRQQLGRLEQELRSIGEPPREGRPPRNRGREEGRAIESAGPQDRLQHLEAAIDHLRAAGMPDVAERLARERERLMNQRGPSAAPAEMRELRNELNELRREVRQLRERVDAGRAEER